jgi:RHS repeat-associated protein
VTARSNGDSFSYDANGNMTQRVQDGVTWTQVFDAENRLVSVSDGATTTTYVYDGGGARLKRIVNEGGTITTTLYVGNMEIETVGSTETQRTVYYGGAIRIVSGDKSGLYYLHSDHLGSVSVLSDANGMKVAGSDVVYAPFGEVRTGNQSDLTDFSYTRQRKDDNTGGLMYYGARYYLPGIQHFVSADSMVPGMTSQAFNRYSYVLNNPVKYNDPTGHTACVPTKGHPCDGSGGGDTGGDDGGNGGSDTCIPTKGHPCDGSGGGGGNSGGGNNGGGGSNTCIPTKGHPCDNGGGSSGVPGSFPVKGSDVMTPGLDNGNKLSGTVCIMGGKGSRNCVLPMPLAYTSDSNDDESITKCYAHGPCIKYYKDGSYTELFSDHEVNHISHDRWVEINAFLTNLIAVAGFVGLVASFSGIGWGLAVGAGAGVAILLVIQGTLSKWDGLGEPGYTETQWYQDPFRDSTSPDFGPLPPEDPFNVYPDS